MEFLRILNSDEITIIIIGKEDGNVVRNFQLSLISMITSLISQQTYTMLVVLADFLVHCPHLGNARQVVRLVYLPEDRLLSSSDICHEQRTSHRENADSLCTNSLLAPVRGMSPSPLIPIVNSVSLPFALSAPVFQNSFK